MRRCIRCRICSSAISYTFIYFRHTCFLMFRHCSLRDKAGASPEGQLWWFTTHHLCSSKVEAEVSLA